MTYSFLQCAPVCLIRVAIPWYDEYENYSNLVICSRTLINIFGSIHNIIELLQMQSELLHTLIFPVTLIQLYTYLPSLRAKIGSNLKGLVDAIVRSSVYHKDALFCEDFCERAYSNVDICLILGS